MDLRTHSHTRIGQTWTQSDHEKLMHDLNAADELAQGVYAALRPKEQAMVREFHEQFGVAYANRPTIPGLRTITLRRDLITEEYREFMDASSYELFSLIGIADALADLTYVIFGTALTFGIDLHEVFAEVHRSNMSKVWPDGTVHKRSDGKVLKPPTYSPADVEGVLARQRHRSRPESLPASANRILTEVGE